MSAESNKQLVKKLYAAFEHRDNASLLAMLAEDVIWRLPGKVPYYSGIYQGQDSVAGFLEALDAHIELQAFELREFIAETDRVVVTGWSRGRVKSTQRRFNNRWVMVFMIREGRITRFEEYADTQALAAAYEPSYPLVRDSSTPGPMGDKSMKSYEMRS